MLLVCFRVEDVVDNVLLVCFRVEGVVDNVLLVLVGVCVLLPVRVTSVYVVMLASLGDDVL